MTRPTAAVLSAMYQDRLLAEYRAPQNRREMGRWDGRAEQKNAACGDAVTVMVCIGDGQLHDVSFTGQGCSIAVASASLMTQCTRGASVRDAEQTIALVDQLMNGGVALPVPQVLEPLQGVVPFAGRHACAMMPWLALGDAIHAANAG